MARFYFICWVFLPFYINSVQTAPRNVRSNEKNNPNILFYDDSNNRNPESISDIQKVTNGLSRESLLENNKPTQATFISNDMKPFNKFPFLDDIRQNWGILINGTRLEDEDDESYKRPINIPKPSEDNTIQPIIATDFKESTGKPLLSASSPHLAVSENSKFITSENKKTKVKPTSCDIARVVCCMRNSNTEKCFLANGCLKKVVPANACQKSEMNEILKKMKDYYSQGN